MRLKITKSKNSQSLYVIKSFRLNGKNTSKIVEKLGTYDDIAKKLDGQDPIIWANKYIEELNLKDKEDQRKIMVQFSPTKLLPTEKQHSFNGGYLFLQKIYHDLKLNHICKCISQKYKFAFNLNSILSRLLYGRILFPSSKSNTFQLSKHLLEQPDFELQHIYRALEIIAKETEFIQAQLYKTSKSLAKRNDKILYYDCTNYFFEIEQEDGLKQYGPSKEHRPNPIVEMGLFMDGDGIPLAFSIHSGNTNEQQTLKPLEQILLKDFSLSRFVVCTDAGLSSAENRKFNDKGNRAFITTQSIKKLKAHLKKWALATDGWFLSGDTSETLYNINDLEESEEKCSLYKNSTFYKERWINENDLEQKLIVTFSIKYRNYQRQIRNSQIERATNLITTKPASISKHNKNDYKRFVKKINITPDGEKANTEIYSINTEIIEKEETFDGFYALCTNLEDKAPDIIRINSKRWEIEESFRIMKSDFKARPVYLSRDDRIKAHFTTCFLALVLYRYLEKNLNEKYTSAEIIHGLRKMNFLEISGDGYIPSYTRTLFTDSLHEVFGFRTDYQIITNNKMKKIFKDTKI